MTSPVPEDLTPIEVAMIRSAAVGETLDLGEGPHGGQPETIDDRQVIRAAVLHQLLADGRWPARYVRLRGARITGHLDMTSSVLQCPVYLKECLFDDDTPVVFDYATGSTIALIGCRLAAGLSGEMLTVTESLDLSQSDLSGSLVLRRAQISGWLNCGGVRLAPRDSRSVALNAERMSVGDDVFLSEGFVAEGALRLDEARIAGRLVCGGARLAGMDYYGRSLSANHLTVENDVFLDAGFAAAGSLQLNEARIAGSLVCSGARLAGTDRDGRSMSGAHVTVANDVFFDAGFLAVGSLSLNDAQITGQLVCSGGRLEHGDSEGRSLFADRISVGGNVFLDDGFSASGTVSFRFARIGRSFRIMPESLAEGAKITAFDGASMKISSTLLWAPNHQVMGAVSLEGTTAGELEDHWAVDRPTAFWPGEGLLHLNGFVYDRIVGTDQATVLQRLAWIRSQYTWPSSRRSSRKRLSQPIATQPYSQLERVYRVAGQERQATAIAIAMRRDIRRYGDISFLARAGNYLMDYTVGYGYQPWRALMSLAAVYIIVIISASITQYHTAAIVPVPQNSAGIHQSLSARRCAASYPCFNAAGYAFDTVIPVINLHEADYWRPNPATAWGDFLLIITEFGAIYGWILALLVGGGAARVLAILGAAPPPGQDSSGSEGANN